MVGNVVDGGGELNENKKGNMSEEFKDTQFIKKWQYL